MLDKFNKVIRAENAKPPGQKNTNWVNKLTKITKQSSSLWKPKYQKFRFI